MPLTEAQAITRLLDRFAFSATPVERDRATKAGFEATLNGLLKPTGADPGATATPAPALKPQPKRNADNPDARRQAQQIEQENRVALGRWWLARMVAAQHQGVERLTWFWHGHFATSFSKVRPVSLMLTQNETFRQHALGDFPTLARKLLVDPAMIHWLDGQKSTVKAPNENLAREFMELFTLGVGRYSETDIREGARALTGWVITDEKAELQPRRQDRKPKTIFGRTGDFDTAGFADLVLARPEVADFVVGRLWFRLVGDHPMPAPTRARILSAWRGGDIAAVLGAIASDPAFRDETLSLVKSPVEWLVGVLRAVGGQPKDWSPEDLTRASQALRAMGQQPFNPPSVGGWPPDSLWLNTATAVARATLAELTATRSGFEKEAAQSTVDARISLLAKKFGVEWTSRTTAALKSADNPRSQLVVAACSPEVVVSR
ncbi:hypothetical protein CGZ93_01610 [Enemella dayhoffiae]|uniref:DUF1800 domain-containing protein n=1 Tax=Enemella dayhoffiae TaxID=2016507 RepID=A0A255HBT8_9ACTN|nr:DUF1800 domain-containing protein [Enemella dayhoffiae]OYO25179.1 hypothetical protein CGZ93_01610 [Enemella dayhoffiae]